jgi:hypothetical protein
MGHSTGSIEMKKFGITARHYNLAAALVLLLPTILSAATDKNIDAKKSLLVWRNSPGSSAVRGRQS